MPSKIKKQDKKEEVLEPEIITTSKEVETLEENFSTVETIKPKANIVLQKQEEKEVYSITPSDIEQFLKNKELSPNNIQDIKEKINRSLQNLKKAWVEFGASVIIVQRSKIFKEWGYETFASYCENELRLKKATIYEIIGSTLFLIQRRPETYEKLMSGKEDLSKLPSYHSIYLIAKKEKKITTKKAQELYDSIVEGKLSTMNLPDKLRKLCGEKKPSVDLVKRYQSWYESLKNGNFSEEIIEKAKELNELLEALNQEVAE